MANTKHRRQFNCYLKDNYATELRQLADQMKRPAGEVIELMLDIFTLRDVGKLTERITELAFLNQLTPDQVERIDRLRQTMDAMLTESDQA